MWPLLEAALWSTVIALAAIPIYLVVLVAFALARKRSQRVTDGTSAVWRNELAITTWVLAAPGLVAAASAMMFGVGLVLLPLGIAVGVIATRVAGGKVSHNYALPLIFVGIVDLVIAVYLVGGASDLSGWEFFGVAGTVLYFALATANAVRILRGGRAVSSGRRSPDSRPETRHPVTTPGTFEPPRDLFVALASRSR